MALSTVVGKIDRLKAVDPALLGTSSFTSAMEVGRMLMSSHKVLDRLTYLKEAGRALVLPSLLPAEIRLEIVSPRGATLPPSVVCARLFLSR